MSEIIIKSPLTITMGRKKYSLNLNVYRNLFYRVSNNLKHTYKQLIRPQISHLKLSRIKLEFTLHRPDRRRVDRSNILSIHEKFLLDALVECGCLPDDSDSYIESSHYYTGDVRKNDGHVEIKIIELADEKL